MEAEYAEPVSDEVQTPKEEGLEWHKDRRNPHPNSGSMGNSNELKQIVSFEPAMPKMVERWAIR